MIFLTIVGVNGDQYTIAPHKITLIMETTATTLIEGDRQYQYWIVLGKHSIEVSADMYTEIMRHIERVTIDVADRKKKIMIPKDLKCEDLELTVRTANCLYNAGIIYVHQLTQKSAVDLLKIKNMGRKSLHELREILEQRFDAKLKGE